MTSISLRVNRISGNEQKLGRCLALKKVDTKVNKNEDKRSTDKEWQEKDKP